MTLNKGRAQRTAVGTPLWELRSLSDSLQPHGL